MLEIRYLKGGGLATTRFSLQADEHEVGLMERRGLGRIRGELDGAPYEIGGQHNLWLILDASGNTVAQADLAGDDHWLIEDGLSTYQLRWKYRTGPDFQLTRDGRLIGKLERPKSRHVGVVCRVPDDVQRVVQAFVSFVALELWRRSDSDRTSSQQSTIAALRGLLSG